MTKDEKAAMDPFTGAKSLPVAARLKLLDQEIRKLHRACTDAGYKPEKIREVADPVLKTARRGTFKKTARYSLYLLLAGCLFAGMFYWPPTYYCMRVITKKFMVYWVLPYYDWTWPFMNECFFNNPFYNPPPDEMPEDFCLTCEELKELTPSYDVNNEDLTDKIYGYEPSIIANAIGNWRAMEQKVNLDTIVEMYATDKRTMSDGGIPKTAFFRTTKDVPDHIKDATSLAKWLHSEEGKEKEFTALWANNHTDSYKALHYWYTKPHFLPSMCEPLRSSNYVMIARRLGEKKGKGLAVRPRFGDLGIWIAQIYGQSEFILQPDEMCTKCKNLRFVLQQGHVLNVPIGLYSISQRPNSMESVAIGVGYEFQ